MADSLRWDRVEGQFGFGGGGGNSIGDMLQANMQPLLKSMKEEQTRQEEAASMAEVQKGLSISDPDLYNQAVRDGIIKVDKYNVDIVRNRAHDLLTDQIAKQQNTASLAESAAALKTRELTDTGARLTNTNTGLLIKNNEQILKEKLDDWNQKIEQRTILPEVMAQIGQLQDMATGGVGPDGKAIAPNPEGALRIARTPGFIQMAIKGGYNQDQLNSLNTSLYAAAQSARTEANAAHQQARLEGTQPIAEATADIAASEALKNAQSGQATGEAERGKAALAAADAEYANKEAQWIKDSIDPILSGVGSWYEMNDRVSAMKLPEGIKETSREVFRNRLHEAAASLATKTPQEYLDWKFENDPNASRGQRNAGLVPSEAAGIVGILDQVENGGGGYSALFNQAQNNPNSPYAGLDVSTKTIGELNELANSGGYKAWVAAQNGGVQASPFGRYQIVNDTLQSAAKALGLDSNTVFDANTQDMIFKYLINNRLSQSSGDLAGQIAGLRKEWTGLIKVDDATLAQAITDFQSRTSGSTIGRMGAKEDTFGSGFQSEGARQAGADAQAKELELALQGAGHAYPVDETHGERASQFMQEMIDKSNSKPMNAQEFNILDQIVTESDSRVSSVEDQLVKDNMFGGNVSGLVAAIQDKANNNKLSNDVATELSQAYPEIHIKNMTTDLNELSDRYNIKPGIIAAFLKAAPAESYWLTSALVGIQDSRHIDMDKASALIEQFIAPGDPNAKDVLLSTLEQQRSKTSASAELAKARSRVAEAYQDLTQTSSRMEANPNISDKKAKIRLQVALDSEKQLIERLYKSNILRAEQTAGEAAQTVSGR